MFWLLRVDGYWDASWTSMVAIFLATEFAVGQLLNPGAELGDFLILFTKLFTYFQDGL
jgi:hypothetical protein